mmetsp:Transcript_11489/g.70638  ORF Transcript_11489/g.70638 Transcript_11489/m.70638 type:complete len:410 (-) Transcript_11489:313-1542(-)
MLRALRVPWFDAKRGGHPPPLAIPGCSKPKCLDYKDGRIGLDGEARAALPSRAERCPCVCRPRGPSSGDCIARRRRFGTAADVIAQNLDHRLECEPLGDLLSVPQHLAELGPRQLQTMQILLLRNVGGHVPLLLGVDDVEAGHGLHTEFWSVLLGEFLGVVRPVEILPGQRGFGACHIASDDEVCTPVVFSDDHVLDRFSGPRHVHGVRQVRPVDVRVVHLLLQDLVRLITHDTWDVVVLGGSAGGMDQAHRSFADIVRVKRPGEQLVVRPMHRIPALEGNHVDVGREFGPDLRGRLARKHSFGQTEPVDGSADVILSTFGGNHVHAWMFEGGRTVAHLGFLCLVRFPLGFDVQHAQVLPAVLEQYFHAGLQIFPSGVHDDGQSPEEVPVGQSHVFHDVFVFVLVEKAT